MTKRVTVEILRCPRHSNFWCVAIGDRRITGSKCCGQWDTVVKWFFTPAEIRAKVKEALFGQR